MPIPKEEIQCSLSYGIEYKDALLHQTIKHAN